ncbi:hypothetical protein APX70_200069 [Pseudomonas syringae pv. maculicola]|uniref:Uncharacterized protein n=1 Tax=Pseudomonas syringae pv. maculicola TaxID=59511 RepID=A0A3M2TM15_PSEYM|nr:hypothetical protein APX70_200069 [Pseudomonas syringae pv. maculicola]
MQLRSGLKHLTGCRQLALLQHHGQVSHFSLQLLAFFFQCTQFVATDRDIKGLWCKCW